MLHWTEQVMGCGAEWSTVFCAVREEAHGHIKLAQMKNGQWNMQTFLMKIKKHVVMLLKMEDNKSK